jgi:hypothetical protein
MSFDPDRAFPSPRIARRAFLGGAGMGLGRVALAALLGKSVAGAEAGARARGVLGAPHRPARAKRIIHLCMAGGPSHVETFDPKPELARLDGKPFPESFTAGQQLAQLQNMTLLARGPFCKYRRCGESGLEIAEIFPHLSRVADRLCIVRSMQTEQINHDPAHFFMNSGSTIKGRPSMGSWLLYGLGAETEDLPGFVVFTSAGNYGQQPVSARQWSAGFLPSQFQGIQFQSRGDAVHYVRTPDGIGAEGQKRALDEIVALDRLLESERADPEIETRIRQYELAFRMQSSIPELLDLSDESPDTLALYGVQHAGDGSFASNCLLARRLAERGVRFIQLYHRAWDHHDSLTTAMPDAAHDVDQASAALIEDLDRRGMLDDTLVLWGGEFGRTPMAQGSGRDHHILAFSVFLAGGGIRGGTVHGATDELGYRAVEDVVSVHDLHATMLHLAGIDHERLTFRYQGRDFRLTDVSGRVIDALLGS